jgi:hypothetical protein
MVVLVAMEVVPHTIFSPGAIVGDARYCDFAISHVTDGKTITHNDMAKVLDIWT